MKITPTARTSVTLPTSTRETGHWSDEAACQGMETEDFYPPDEQSQREVGQICLAGCPVIDQCREHALTYPERYGVWAGLTEHDRERIWNRQRRRRVAV